MPFLTASTQSVLWVTSITSTSLLALVTLIWRRERASFAERAAKLASEAAAERKARIRHEIAARENKKLSEEYPTLGHIRTMFAGRYGTPRQGALAKSTLGVIQIDARVLDGTSIEGLEQFSFAWLLFVFHENTNEHKIDGKRTYKSKIKPPGMLGEKTGVLATRTPHRPSRIGLSLVKIVKVEPEKSRLTVSAVDLLDGTPIIDIKPFVPMDSPWESPVRYPEWVVRSMNDGDTNQDAPLDVIFSEAAKGQLAKVIGTSERSQLFFTDVKNAMEVLTEALRLDFRAVHQGRYGTAASEQYEVLRMKICDFEMEFTIKDLANMDSTSSNDRKAAILTVEKITQLQEDEAAEPLLFKKGGKAFKGAAKAVAASAANLEESS